MRALEEPSRQWPTRKPARGDAAEKSVADLVAEPQPPGGGHLPKPIMERPGRPSRATCRLVRGRIEVTVARG